VGARQSYDALQKHARRCEDELRRLKRIPAAAELTFDEEEEKRRADAAHAREECARLSAQMAALTAAVAAAASEAYVSPFVVLVSCAHTANRGLAAEAVAVPLAEAVRRIGARAASTAHEAASAARLLSLHQRDAALLAAFPSTPALARVPPAAAAAAAVGTAPGMAVTPKAVAGTPTRIPRVALLSRTPAQPTPRRPVTAPGSAARRPQPLATAAVLAAATAAAGASPRTPSRLVAGGSPLVSLGGLRPQTPLQALMASVGARSRSHTPLGAGPLSARSGRATPQLLSMAEKENPSAGKSAVLGTPAPLRAAVVADAPLVNMDDEEEVSFNPRASRSAAAGPIGANALRLRIEQ
jgi:hypothetical protein